MSAGSEEAQLRFGVDGKSVNASLRGVEQAFQETGHKIAHVFEEVGQHVMGAFAVGAIIAKIEGALTRAQTLMRQADSLGTSTDFIQDISNVGRAAGLSEEKIGKMLNKFSTTLPDNADLEEEFYKIADAIMRIEDPAERVGLAVEYFGKKIGPQFVSTLMRGREGIKEFAAEFAKFSNGDVKGLEESKLAIEKVENILTITIGRGILMTQYLARLNKDLIQGFLTGGHMGHSAANFVAGMSDDKGHKGDGSGSFASSALIDYKNHLDDIKLHSKTASAEEKIALLTSMKAVQEHEVGRAKTEEKRYAHLKKVADIEQQILDIKKEQEETAKKTDEAYAKSREKFATQMLKVTEHQQEVDDIRKKPYEYSLEDLAKVGWYTPSNAGTHSGWGVHGGFWNKPTQSWEAQRILDMRSRARSAFEWGNNGLGENLRSRADAAFDTLAKNNPYLINPEERAARQLEKQTTILQDFRDNGMPVVPSK